MPRTSTVVGLRCPVPDCHGMLRVLHVAHAVNGAYTRRSRVCRICGTRQTTLERFVGPMRVTVPPASCLIG